MKKLFLIFCMTLLIGTISAWEIDNYGSYDTSTKTMTVKNGFTFGTPIAEIQLKTPLNVVVPRGYQKVAEFEIRANKNYTTALKELELFDREKNNQKFTRNYDYKYKNIKQVLVNNYSTSCSQSISKNGTIIKNCEQIIIGSYYKDKIEWLPFSTDLIKDKVLTIGIFTEVKKGDKVEWVPNIMGVRIDEWATWTEGLNVGIVHNYHLDNNDTGVTIDGVAGANNGTLINNPKFITGILDNALNFTSANSERVDLPPETNFDALFSGSNPFTISMWIKQTDDGGRGNEGFIDKGFDPNMFYWGKSNLANDGKLQLTIKSGTLYEIRTNNNVLPLNSWSHVVLVYDGTYSTGATIYVNGTSVPYTVSSAGTPTLAENNDVAIGRGFTGAVTGYFNGAIDEVNIWNRTLNNSEVTDLYNNGTGITFTNIFPILTTNLISPINVFNSSSSTIEFSVNSTPSFVNLTNVTLYIWNNNNSLFLTNFTSLSGNVVITTNWTISSIPDGNYIWNAFTEGTNGNSDWADSNRTFEVDLTNPLINVTSPRGLIDYYLVGDNLTLNWSVVDTNLQDCWFNYNNVNTTVVCGDNNYSFVTTTQNNLTFYANDTFGNLGSNFTSWEILFEEYNVTFNNQTFEGVQETFTANITLLGGNTISQSIFYYNNTNYTTNIIFSGGKYLVTSSITVPLVESTTNFSLGFFIIISGQTYNLETFQQEVLNINMSICSPGGNLLLNITLHEEETKTIIIGDIEFNAQAISKTSGEIIESIELSVESISVLEICLSPAEAFTNLFLDAEIKYSSDNFESELYHIQQADMINYPKNLSLFDLLTNKSTEFLIKYQDDDLISVEGAIIQLQRKYISEDIFEIVEAPLTSDLGTSIVHINLDGNKYQVTVVKDGVVLNVFDNIVFYCENALAGQCTKNLLGEIDSQNNVPLIQLEDFAYSISSFNNTITTLFSIPSGTPASVNILLVQKDQFGNESICNQTIISSAGSIDCVYEDTIGESFLFLEISKDGLLKANRGFIVVQDSGLDWLGNNFFLVIIMMLSVVGMAFSSPELIILNAIVVMILGGAFWLINGVDFVMGLGSLIWLLISAGILIYSLSKQEDR